MDKKTRDLNAAECMIWMFKNNPGKVDIYMNGDYPKHLIFFTHFNNLKFPDGWYYACDSKTINRKDGNISVRIVIRE